MNVKYKSKGGRGGDDVAPLLFMSDLKPEGTKIELGKNKYALRFTINAIDEIQDHFNISIDELPKILSNEREIYKNIRFLLTVLINEDIDCQNDELAENKSKEFLSKVDEKYVGRHLDAENLSEMSSKILKSVSDGTPKSDEDETSELDDEIEDPNA